MTPDRLLLDLRAAAYGPDPSALAARCGCSTSTIYAFRSGRTAWPRGQTLLALAEALGFEIAIVRKRAALRSVK